MDEPAASVSVADLVATLRAELEQLDAERRRKGLPALLALDSVDIELQFTVAADGNGEAKLRIPPDGVPQKMSLHFTVDETARREGRLGSRAHSSTFSLPADDDVEPLESPSDADDAR